MKKLLLLFILFPSLANAQVVRNPQIVEFIHEGYATAARYEGGYFMLVVKSDNTCDTASTSGSLPVTTDNLGKPPQLAGLISTNLIAKPIGCYVYKVRALDQSSLWSDWSDPSNPFLDPPAKVTAVVIK